MKITRETLKNQIEVMDSTFERLNLEVIGVGISNLNEDGWFDVIVELRAIADGEVETPIDIKVNIYDENGIVLTDSFYIANRFDGYDTISIQLLEENISSISKRIRLFATKA